MGTPLSSKSTAADASRHSSYEEALARKGLFEGLPPAYIAINDNDASLSYVELELEEDVAEANSLANC